MNHPHYLYKPIISVSKLALYLGQTEQQINDVAANADSYYKISKILEKQDGSKRYTYSVDTTLRKIQEKIKEKIFKKVDYPEYLKGALKGRDYFQNCAVHSGKYVVISEDATNFFPSIKYSYVNSLYKKFFGFTPEVAKILTLLTTYQGSLAQGCVTSSYIANLIFWDEEPIIVENLKNHNILYTRFVDDITMSSKSRISKEDMNIYISSIHKMLNKKGIKVNRKKHTIETSNKRMAVHRVTVNSSHPTFSKAKKSEIRSLVKKVELKAAEGREDPHFRKFYDSVICKVNNMERCHSPKANELKNRLKKVKPVSLTGHNR